MINYEQTKIRKIRLTLILVIVIAFFVGVILYMVAQIQPKKTKQNYLNYEGNNHPVTQEAEKTQPKSICVIKAVDEDENKIKLYDTKREITLDLFYTGATNIIDKYGKVISAAQLTLGDMVDVIYDASNQNLEFVQRSSDTWTYERVSDIVINRTEKIIKLYGQNYQYTSDLYIRNSDEEITLLSINSDDVLTIRGYNHTIYSITVTRGHGTISLENYDYFLGGNLYIGSNEYVSLTEDMVFTVPEGNYNVTIEKGDVTGTKNINVLRDQETIVDMAIFEPNPVQTGEVTFKITPFGADLMIDGVLVSYANSVELEYGEHTIEVSLDGYETYEGTFTLDQSSDIVQIELPETVVEEETDSDKSTSGNSDSSSNTTDKNTSSESTDESKDSSDNEESKASTKDNEDHTTDENHFIYIKAPVGASVYLNGVYEGVIPLKIDKVLGTTYFTLIQIGFEQVTHTVTIEDDNQDKYYTFPNMEQIKIAE